MTEMTIRLAKPQETDAIHDLWMSSPDRDEWTPSLAHCSDLLAVLDLLSAEGRVWVVEDESQALQGFAAASDLDSALFLTGFGISKKYRREGLASALLMPVIQFGKWAYYPALTVIGRRHAPSVSFFRKQGFVEMDGSKLDDSMKTILNKSQDDPRQGHSRVALAMRL